MASELRVNTSTNRVGLGTITYTDTGPIISGITTGNNFKTGTTNVHSTGVELANINTGGSTATFGGDLSIPDTIVHTGDTNTKIRFPSNDTVSVETAGQQNVQVTADRTRLTSPSGTDTTVRLQHQGNSGYGDIILDRQVNAFIIDNDPTNASNNLSYFSVKNKGVENFRIGSTGISTFTNDVRIVKSAGPLLELTTNTGAADATLRLSEGAVGSTSNGGGMFYSGADNKLYITCGTNSTTKRITIQRDDGKVGINQNTPTAQLQIGAPNTATGVLRADPGYFSIDSGWVNGGSVGGVVGSATNPCLIFGGDGNTGLYHSASDTVNFATGGTERLRLDSTGRVLIGAGAIAAPKASVGGLDISSGLLSIVVGGEANTGNGTPRTNSVQKEARICVPHYTLAEEPTAAVVVFNSSSANRINIGGATGLCNSATDIRFFTAANTTTTSGTQRLRITSTGEVRIGDSSTTAATSGDDLVIEGSSDRGLSIISGSASSGNIYFGHSSDADEGRIAYQHNDNALDFSVNAGSTRFRIHQAGVYAYGNDNVFLGGTSGSNLNGELTIRSTGTAVYQHLRFKSSNGSSQSQIMGYGGGAILFHYSDQFVWAINNQGERLNLTNTALAPRTNSTVLDLGTTGNRYRRTYTDGITVNTSNTNTKFCINGGSSANVMTIRNTTGGNGNVGILFSTQDHSGGREKAAIYHQETHGQAHYGGDFIFCLANSTGGAAQVTTSDERLRIMRSGDVQFGDNPHNALWSATNHAGTYYRKGQGSLASATRANTGYSSYYINKNTGAGGSADQRWIDFYWNTNHYGRISYNGASGTTYGTSSDYRLKENAVSITDGIEKVKQLKPYRFNFISDTTDKVVQGFFAHEAQEVVPYAVSGTKDEVVTQAAVDEGSQPEEKVVGDPIYQDVDYAKFTPILTAALQEAILKIEVLEAKVATLESS